MASVTEYLVQLQKLTQTNLDILKSINDSFFTKQNHLSVNIAGSNYAIPSFLSLENKINYLTEGFNNLINAPQTGEAHFNLDGNTRSIEVKSYNTTPKSLILNNIENFNIETNNIFKEFLTPVPYVNINLQSVPNNITKTVVKKIIPIHNDLIEFFKSFCGEVGSAQYAYKDLYKKLILYKKDIDYTEYDTIVDMPIRKNIGSGYYVIQQILNDIVDENLENYITVKIRNDIQSDHIMNCLKYRLFDETIEKQLKVGDYLTTYDGNAKIEITNIQYNTNTITFKVLNGEFLNLLECPNETNIDNIPSLSQLRFFSPIDFDNDKYIKIPLEEDQYIYIAVAPLNTNMNIQSPWGSGLLMNTFLLKNNDQYFNDYYKKNVINIGDILYKMTAMMADSFDNFYDDDLLKFSKIVPVIDQNNLLVTQINNHLNNSTTIKNIRALYSQKKEYQTQLNEIRDEVATINETLSTISFDDTTGIRSSYTSQLIDLSAKENELTTAVNKILIEISNAANNSEIPIENAKYRVRGFFDYTTFLTNEEYPNLIKHIKGIRVQYRYKTIDQEQGLAISIKDKFIFSDWNVMDNFDRPKIPFESGFKLQDDNSNINEPSFNQIDIPISQGETIDIRLKLIYDFGYPFVEYSSDWSPIINIEFPEEYLKNVQILDIIKENNDEIETHRFQNILLEGGVSKHINDNIVDQDSTYYHKPENISSGFYTTERRIIPLKDKLTSMDTQINQIYSEVFGAGGESLVISIKNSSSNNILYPYQINNVIVESYEDISINNTNISGDYEYDADTKFITTVLNISIKNNSNKTTKLYSLFPGDRSTPINSLRSSKYDKSDYCIDKQNGENVNNYGIQLVLPSLDSDKNIKSKLQSCNQILTFRIADINTGNKYFDKTNLSGNPWENNDMLCLNSNFISYKNMTPNDFQNTCAFIYPKLTDEYSLHLNSDSIGSFLTMAPNEEIIIPIIFEYRILNNSKPLIHKTLSFDLRPSLYSDPITYTFRVIAKRVNSIQDKIISSNKKQYQMSNPGINYTSIINHV